MDYVHLVFQKCGNEMLPIACFDKMEDANWFVKQMKAYSGDKYDFVCAARIEKNPKYSWLEEFAKERGN